MNTEEILSHGFSAGNYANAYTSEDLDDAWAEEEREDDEKAMDGVEETKLYRAGFIIGFFASHTSMEVPDDHLEELLAAHQKYGKQMLDAGIAVGERDGEGIVCECHELFECPSEDDSKDGGP